MDADELRAWRKRMDLTQEQLAQLLGVTRQSVYLWETGARMPAGRMLALALRGLEQERTQDAGDTDSDDHGDD